jgi:Kinesin motor domain
MNDTSTVARINAQCYRLSSHLSVHRDKYERPPLYMVDTEHEPPSAAISPTNVPAEQTDVAGRDDEALIEPISVRDDASCVQVAVRVRPLITLEGDDESCVQVLHQSVGASHATAIQVGGPSGPRFTFDQVFGVKSTQQYVYETRVAPLIVSCLEGYNATILAYGQTGSGVSSTSFPLVPGIRTCLDAHDFACAPFHLATPLKQKTHTIMGPDPTVAAASPDDSDLGVIPRAFRAIFDALGEKKESQRQMGVDLEYQVSVQFLELYGEEIRDLLTTHRNSSGSSEKLYIRDLGTDEPEVVGATQTPVSSALEALRCLAHGMLRRVTGATAMNESSSRSHAILTVCIEQSSVVVDSKPMSASTSSAEGSDDCDINEDHIQMTRSKFNFVDLAGAERQKRTGATGKRLQEGIDINKGLSNLGNVISALGDPKKRGKTHVPYRDAKLTRLLKGSLGGNHKTLMIACISPAAVNMGESLNCLRYANRAKNIQNKAVVNVDANTRLVQELQGQVKALATDLLRALDGETDGVLFERSVLVSLANGTSGSVPISPTPSKPSREASEVALRLKETENELRKTRDKLRQTQSYQDAAELELHTLRAQNELCDMQIAALTQERNGALVIPETMQTAVLEKMTTYEGEIDRLKKALHEAESKANAENWNLSNCSDDEWLEREKQTLHSDRNRLECIRAMSSEDAETQYHIACDSEIGDATQNDQDPTEGDEEEDRGMMDSLANKYVKYATEDADDTDFDASLIEAPPLRKRRVRQVAADLEELSQSIAMKEKLIEQIRRNKEREAVSETGWVEIS